MSESNGEISQLTTFHTSEPTPLNSEPQPTTNKRRCDVLVCFLSKNAYIRMEGVWERHKIPVHGCTCPSPPCAAPHTQNLHWFHLHGKGRSYIPCPLSKWAVRNKIEWVCGRSENSVLGLLKLSPLLLSLLPSQFQIRIYLFYSPEKNSLWRTSCPAGELAKKLQVSVVWVSEGLQDASNTHSTATEDMLCFFHNQKYAPISSIHEKRQYCNMLLAAFPQKDGSTTAWVWGRATKNLSHNTCVLLLFSFLYFTLKFSTCFGS
jgi:hypothetical protein